MADFLRACWFYPAQDGAGAEGVGGGDDARVASLRDYTAELNRMADRAPSALYSVGQGGPLMQRLAPQRARLDGPEFKMEPRWLLLTELDSLETSISFDDAAMDVFSRSVSSSLVEIPTRAVYRELISRTGPDVDAGYAFPPVIQFGRFSAPSPEGEWALTKWHNDVRMAEFTTTPGGIRARRFSTVCGGYSKFAVLYAFTSIEERLQTFENVHEARAHAESNPTPAHQTVHEPHSSLVGVLLTGFAPR